MPLEIWILGGLGVVASMLWVVVRLIGAGKRSAQKETKNVYPLW